MAVHCFQSFDVVIIGADGTVLQQLKLSDDPRPAPRLHWVKSIQPEAVLDLLPTMLVRAAMSKHRTMAWYGTSAPGNLAQRATASASGSDDSHRVGRLRFQCRQLWFQGPASIVGRPATTAEAEGLAAFLSSLIGAPRASTDTRPDGSYTDAALRGELFERSCPAPAATPPLYTSRTLVPKGKSGEPADVPSLLGSIDMACTW